VFLYAKKFRVAHPYKASREKYLGLTKGELKMKESEWVQLTRWEDYFDCPSYGTMRNIVSRRKENGAEAFLSFVNGRFYVHRKKFNEWMESRKEKNRLP
jgi:hypothetical protein